MLKASAISGFRLKIGRRLGRIPRMKRNYLMGVMTAVMTVLGPAFAWAAEKGDGFVAPEIDKAKGGWIPYLAAAFFVLATLAIGFKPSGRTHLD